MSHVTIFPAIESTTVRVHDNCVTVQDWSTRGYSCLSFTTVNQLVSWLDHVRHELNAALATEPHTPYDEFASGTPLAAETSPSRQAGPSPEGSPAPSGDVLTFAAAERLARMILLRREERRLEAEQVAYSEADWAEFYGSEHSKDVDL